VARKTISSAERPATGKRLVLASTSPRRRDLLEQAGIPFEVAEPPDVEVGTVAEGNSRAEALAQATALAKARAVFGAHRQAVVLGADTVVVCNGDILGKPTNRTEARRMLLRLSDRPHRVITGLALVGAVEGQIRELTGWEQTIVHFDRLDREEIESYLDTAEPYDKAGAYAIQGRAALFIRAIEGCYSNVVGLPLNLLRRLLREMGVRPVGEA